MAEKNKDGDITIPVVDLREKIWDIAGDGNFANLEEFLKENKDKVGVLLNEENDEYEEDGGHVLMYCVKEGCDSGPSSGRDYVQCCRLLVKHGAKIDHQDKAGRTSLHWAVFYQNVNLVTVLVELGANLSIYDQDHMDAFHLSILLGSAQTFLALTKDQPPQFCDRKDGKGTPPIVSAVQNGHLEICRLLLERGVNINETDQKLKRTALQYAILSKRYDIFETLVSHKPSLSIPDHHGKTVFLRACAIKDTRYFHKLLYTYKDIPKSVMDSSSDDGITPVIAACQNGNPEQLKELLDKGASVTDADKANKTALHYCADNLETQCAEMILHKDKGLLNRKDDQGFTPLHMAVIGGNAPLLKLLLKKGADINCLDNERHSVAHWATVCGHLEVLDILLENGADVSKPDSHDAFPIHYAAQMNGKENGHADHKIGEKVLKKLVDNGVPFDVVDKDGRQPLLWAASAGNTESCKLLVKAGADVNSTDKDGLSAMHCAASRGHVKSIEVLKGLGSDVDLADKNNCTPIFYAITLGNKECTKALLKFGANPNHQDNRGRTPSHCASIKGCIDTVKMLDKHSAQLWTASSRGDCPIHEASQGGFCDVVKYLLKSKNDSSAVNIPNKNGRTCLHIAAIVNNLPLCKLLIDNGADKNAKMNHKDKSYTPYDAAIVKDHLETANYIKGKGGASASDVDNVNKKRDSKSAKSRRSIGTLGSTQEDTKGEEEEETKEKQGDVVLVPVSEEKDNKETKDKNKNNKEKDKEDDDEDEVHKDEGVASLAVAVGVKTKGKKDQNKDKGKTKGKTKDASKAEKKEEEKIKEKKVEEKEKTVGSKEDEEGQTTDKTTALAAAVVTGAGTKKKKEGEGEEEKKEEKQESETKESEKVVTESAPEKEEDTADNKERESKSRESSPEKDADKVAVAVKVKRKSKGGDSDNKEENTEEEQKQEVDDTKESKSRDSSPEKEKDHDKVATAVKAKRKSKGGDSENQEENTEEDQKQEAADTKESKSRDSSPEKEKESDKVATAVKAKRKSKGGDSENQEESTGEKQDSSETKEGKSKSRDSSPEKEKDPAKASAAVKVKRKPKEGDKTDSGADADSEAESDEEKEEHSRPPSPEKETTDEDLKAEENQETKDDKTKVGVAAKVVSSEKNKDKSKVKTPAKKSRTEDTKKKTPETKKSGTPLKEEKAKDKERVRSRVGTSVAPAATAVVAVKDKQRREDISREEKQRKEKNKTESRKETGIQTEEDKKEEKPETKQSGSQTERSDTKQSGSQTDISGDKYSRSTDRDRILRTNSVEHDSEGEFEVPEGSPENAAELLALQRERSRSTASPESEQEEPQVQQKQVRSPNKVPNNGKINQGLLAKTPKPSRQKTFSRSRSVSPEDEVDNRDQPVSRKKRAQARLLNNTKTRKRDRDIARIYDPDNLSKPVGVHKQIRHKKKTNNRDNGLVYGPRVASLLEMDQQQGEINDIQSSLARSRLRNRGTNSVQDSVRRYQDERRMVRQLHQLKRAQIYTGPIHDVVLFSKLMDVYKNSAPHDDESTLDSQVLEDWEGYLREQLRFVSHFYEDDRTGLRSMNTTARSHAQRLEREANTAKQQMEEKFDDMLLMEEQEMRDRKSADEKIHELAKKTDETLSDVQHKANDSLSEARKFNESLQKDFRRDCTERLQSAGSTASKREQQWLREDEVRSRAESIEKDRKEKHREWHKQKNEELRRKLMKVYGPSQDFLDQVGKQKSSTPRTTYHPTMSRPKSITSSSEGRYSHTNYGIDREITVQMTEYGMRRVKKDDFPFGKRPKSKSLQFRNSQSLPANWTPKFDGHLRPRAGLVYVEPEIYTEVLREEKRLKQAYSTAALSSRNNLTSDESTILSPVTS